MKIEKFNPNGLEKLNKEELDVFSNELMNDFQMMETYAGGNKNSCSNSGGCPTYGICIWVFCGEDCKVKAWFNCGGVNPKLDR